MKLSITINGQESILELASKEPLVCSLDGVSFESEAVEVQPGVFSLLLGGKSYQARVSPAPDDANAAAGAPSSNYSVQVDGVSYAVSVRDPRRRPRGGAGLAVEGQQNIAAPMPGKVVRLLVSENQVVEAGQGLIVVEAMKMQNEIKCPKSGCVQKILVREGQNVNAGETLLRVE